MHGTIKRVFYDRGFGFIRAEDGADVFFRRGNLMEPIFQELHAGEAVEFELAQDRRGPRGDSCPRRALTGGTIRRDV